MRAALLNTATPCDPDIVEEPERCLRGIVNLPGAMRLLFGQSVTISFAGAQVTRTEHQEITISDEPGTATSDQAIPSESLMIEASESLALPSSSAPIAATSATTATDISTLTPSQIKPSTAYSGNVYALGTIAYDFGDEARRDTFKQNMAPVNLNGVLVPADPYDARQMVEHLDNNPMKPIL